MAEADPMNPMLPNANDGTITEIKDLQDASLHAVCNAIAEDYLVVLRQHVVSFLDLPKGISLREVRTLSCIFRYAHDITAARIVEILRYNPPTVTRAIKRLKASGFVTTEPSPYDARSQIIFLTPSGENIARQYRDEYLKFEAWLARRDLPVLSEEDMSTFMRIAKKVAARTDSIRRLKVTRKPTR